jgi:hypothetical protein
VQGEGVPNSESPLLGLTALLDDAMSVLKSSDLNTQNAFYEAYKITGQMMQSQQMQQPEPKVGKGTRVSDYDLKTRRTHYWWALRKFVGDFLMACYDEVYRVLCTDGKLAEALRLGGTDSKSIGTALAASLTASLGLTNPIAIGVSAILIVVVARAGVTAFCSLNRQEVLQLIYDIPPPDM